MSNMSNPILSSHFLSREPSSIRLAQIESAKRTDGVDVINTAIGNVSLPMHPAMQKRVRHLGDSSSPFAEGVVKYSATVGMPETVESFLHILKSSGLETKNLRCQITDGGSQAMELMILGVCGPAGLDERPLLLLDPAYSNYQALVQRTGRKMITVARHLQKNGEFSLPDFSEIELTIKKHNPGAMVVIPYDNPTGQFFNIKTMIELGKLCVRYNLWMVSDEAYRELHYTESEVSSVWALTEASVPGITGRRMSIETASKVWNACGLRIGALITDNQLFHEKCVAENTANLCSNTIGQYIFGALAHENIEDLRRWYWQQRNYYKALLGNLTTHLKELLPGIIISSADAALYTVVDVGPIVKKGFRAIDFVMYCARKGKVVIDGRTMTLLMAPMDGFYSSLGLEANPGETQLRLAYVETPERLQFVPRLFAELLEQFEKERVQQFVP